MSNQPDRDTNVEGEDAHIKGGDANVRTGMRTSRRGTRTSRMGTRTSKAGIHKNIEDADVMGETSPRREIANAGGQNAIGYPRSKAWTMAAVDDGSTGRWFVRTNT
jgi:hypothetical protein